MPGTPTDMEIRLGLALPRDAKSVPVIRRILRDSLTTIGVSADTVSDIELALTEACTNVLDHAGGVSDYEVTALIDGRSCVLEVTDEGVGYAAGIAEEAPMHAEGGRGLQLMQAVVDHVSVAKRPSDGTVVRMEKHLKMANPVFH
jgi:serine/threonine-protein kinase RsbW